MRQNEIQCGRRGPRAQMWIPQLLENKQRCGTSKGDWEEMDREQAEARVWCRSSQGRMDFLSSSLPNTAEGWRSMKTDGWLWVGHHNATNSLSKTVSIHLGERCLAKVGSKENGRKWDGNSDQCGVKGSRKVGVVAGGWQEVRNLFILDCVLLTFVVSWEYDPAEGEGLMKQRRGTSKS